MNNSILTQLNKLNLTLHNSLNDPNKLIKYLKKLFKIQKIYYSDSIQDKILRLER